MNALGLPAAPAPMPANFDTALTEPEFRNLMGYLLEQRVQK